MDSRQRAYEAINSLGAVVSLNDVDDLTYSIHARILLPYHPRTFRVLAGPWYGLRLRDAKQMAMREAMAADLFEHVSCGQVMLRPWWRLWQRTPALVVHLEARP